MLTFGDYHKSLPSLHFRPFTVKFHTMTLTRHSTLRPTLVIKGWFVRVYRRGIPVVIETMLCLRGVSESSTRM